MDEKIAEGIALLRHQIISPVLTDSDKTAMNYFRQISTKDFDVPGRGPRRYAPGTMRLWLYAYRKKGFQALKPKMRTDKGSFRLLADSVKDDIRKLRQLHPDLSCVKFYDRLINEGKLGVPPICIETLRRFLKVEGLYSLQERTPRKRFEMRYFGELWTADFMHGPYIFDGKRQRRAILMAIIDDHSRLITGFQWSWSEDTKLLEETFKEALLKYGLPDRFYCDNGAAFSSSYLSLVCANTGIGLVHSKPYDSPSRGKIERFFRTVRQNFLPDVEEKNPTWTLKKLRDFFTIWIRDYYHQRVHNGIQMRPIDRYQNSITDFPRKRIDEETLEEYFLVSIQRSVGKDSTISLNNVAFEVPPQYIGKKVDLKFSQNTGPTEVFLYDNGIRITKITPVDSQLNGQTYKPTPRISDVALHCVPPGDKP
jgi:transposase InsO family protein